MSIASEFPYAGMSISFLATDEECWPKLLDKCLSNISLEDLEMLYIYDLENIPETIRVLREREIDKDLIKSVFSFEGKNLRDKDELKLKYFEFINYCINGKLVEMKFYVKSQEP